MASSNSGIPIKCPDVHVCTVSGMPQVADHALPRYDARVAEQDSDGSAQSTADMTAFVQNLLIQMQTRFQAMSENIISKIDEMGARIDELEQSINDLKAEMGSEGMPTPSKIKEESKPSDSSA